MAFYRAEYVKFLALLASICGSILQNAVFLSTQRDTFYWAIGIVSFIGILYLVLSVAYSIILYGSKRNCQWSSLVHIILGFLYYTASTIVPIFSTKGHGVGCTEYCQDILQYAEVVLLLLVVTGYIALQYCLKVCSELKVDSEDEKAFETSRPGCILASESLVLLVEFNAVYTVIERSLISDMNNTSSINNTIVGITCPATQFYAVWIIYALMLAVYVLLLYVVFNQQYRPSCKAFVCNFIPIFHIFVCALYLLGGNALPLLCFEVLRENSFHEGIARIAITGAALISMGAAMATICGFPCLGDKTQKLFDMKKRRVELTITEQ